MGDRRVMYEEKWVCMEIALKVNGITVLWVGLAVLWVWVLVQMVFSVFSLMEKTVLNKKPTCCSMVVGPPRTLFSIGISA